MKKTPLYDVHASCGATFDDFAGWLMPKSYGNDLEEYQAVRNNVGIVDLSHRGKLRLSGREHVKFLQGMLTNDVNKLEEGRGMYATLLTVKGRVISDMTVYREKESMLLDLEPGLNEKIREHLIKFRLSYRANIEDVTENLALLSVHGPNSRKLLQKTIGENFPELSEYGFLVKGVNGYQIMIARANRTGEEGYDVFVTSEGGNTLWESLAENGKEVGLKPVGLDTMEILRIEAGIPKYGVDVTENTIPIEAGLWHALNFEKGCYVGQEVIARIKWRGHVNWHLVGLKIEGDGLPLSGDKIVHDGREIGYVTSSTFSPILKKVIALGYIRREFRDPGTKVLVRTDGEEKSAEVADTPFLQS